jgi:hypothetical protein
MSGKLSDRSQSTPPIAAVNVTPMMVDRAVVAPSMDSPTDMEGSKKYTVIAPTLAAPSPRLMACRPGSNSGAESSTPWSFPYATSEPLQITIIMINLGGTVAQL